MHIKDTTLQNPFFRIFPRGSKVDISGYLALNPPAERKPILLPVETLARYFKASKIRDRNNLASSEYKSLFFMELNGLNLKSLAYVRELLDEVKRACGYEVPESFFNSRALERLNEVIGLLNLVTDHKGGNTSDAETETNKIKDTLVKISEAAIEASKIKNELIRASARSNNDTEREWLGREGINTNSDEQASALSNQVKIDINQLLVDDIPVTLIRFFNAFSGGLKEILNSNKGAESREILLLDSLFEVQEQINCFKDTINDVRSSIEESGYTRSRQINNSWLTYANTPPLPLCSKESNHFMAGDGVQAFVHLVLGFGFSNTHIPSNYSPFIAQISLLDLNRPEILRAYQYLGLSSVSTKNYEDSLSHTRTLTNADKQRIHGNTLDSTISLIQNYVEMRLYLLHRLEKRLDKLESLIAGVASAKRPKKLQATNLPEMTDLAPQANNLSKEKIAEELQSAIRNFDKLRRLTEQKTSLYKLTALLKQRNSELFYGFLVLPGKTKNLISQIQKLRSLAVKSVLEELDDLRCYRRPELAELDILLEKALCLQSEIARTERKIGPFINYVSIAAQNEGIEYEPANVEFIKRYDSSKKKLAVALSSLLSPLTQPEREAIVNHMTSDYKVPKYIGKTESGHIILFFENKGTFDFSIGSVATWKEEFAWDSYKHSLTPDRYNSENKSLAFSSTSYKDAALIPQDSDGLIQVKLDGIWTISREWLSIDGFAPIELPEKQTSQAPSTPGNKRLPQSNTEPLPDLQALPRTVKGIPFSKRIPVKKQLKEAIENESPINNSRLQIINSCFEYLVNGKETDIFDFEFDSIAKKTTDLLLKHSSQIDELQAFRTCVATVTTFVRQLKEKESLRLKKTDDLSKSFVENNIKRYEELENKLEQLLPLN